MSNPGDFEKISQSAIDNVRVGGNFFVGNINMSNVAKVPNLPQPTGTPQNIPHSGVVQFVGRSQELETLHQNLQDQERVAISAISGMGGVGKTELAIQYATKYQSLYPGGICWLKARLSNLQAQIIDFVQLHMGLPVPQDLWGKTLDLEQQIEWCWQHWRPSGLVLIILDDITDLAEYKKISPPKERFRVLLTTRKRQLDPSFLELSLDILSPQSSLDLLQLFISEEQFKSEAKIAERLCKWLGYLPLGLELVGRYLAEEPELSLAEMLKFLEHQKLQHQAIADDEVIKNNYHLMTAQHNIKAAFELSWQKLDVSTSNVARLLALFAPDIIPWQLVESTGHLLNWSDEVLKKAKTQLYKLNLIQKVKEDYYIIHPLIREFLQLKLTQSEELDCWKKAFVKSITQIAKKTPETLFSKELQLLSINIPHIALIANEMTEYLSDIELCHPFNGIARFYERQGLYKLAEPWWEKCLTIARFRFSVEHCTVDIVDSLKNLAKLYRLQARFSEAELLYRQILEIRTPLIDIDWEDLADSLHGLGLIFIEKSLYDEAYCFLIRALNLRKSYLGEAHIQVANSLEEIALFHSFTGNYHKAEILYQQALKTKKDSLGEKNVYVADTIVNLVKLLVVKKHLENSTKIHKFLTRFFCFKKEKQLLYKAISIYEELLGCDHLKISTAFSILAEILIYQGFYKKSCSYCFKVLDISQKYLQASHPIVAEQYGNLALSYYFQQKYYEAIKNGKKSLDILLSSVGKDNYNVAIVMSSLGLCYASQGKYHKSESYLIESKNIRKRLLDNKHPVAYLMNEYLSIKYIIFIQILSILFVLEAFMDSLIHKQLPWEAMTMFVLIKISNIYWDLIVLSACISAILLRVFFIKNNFLDSFYSSYFYPLTLVFSSKILLTQLGMKLTFTPFKTLKYLFDTIYLKVFEDDLKYKSGFKRIKSRIIQLFYLLCPFVSEIIIINTEIIIIFVFLTTSIFAFQEKIILGVIPITIFFMALFDQINIALILLLNQFFFISTINDMESSVLIYCLLLLLILMIFKRILKSLDLTLILFLAIRKLLKKTFAFFLKTKSNP